MEDFEALLHKYQKTIDLLETESARLAEKTAAGDDRKLATQMEIAKLQSELFSLRHFVDMIPEDMKRQIQSMQKQQGRNSRQEK